MTIGNLLQIDAIGPEEYYLYGNPQTTYFKSVYKRSTNFAIDYYKVSENYFNNVDFGSTVKIKIPHIGDLWGGLYLEMNFRDIERVDDYVNIDDSISKMPKGLLGSNDNSSADFSVWIMSGAVNPSTTSYG